MVTEQQTILKIQRNSIPLFINTMAIINIIIKLIIMNIMVNNHDGFVNIIVVFLICPPFYYLAIDVLLR